MALLSFVLGSVLGLLSLTASVTIVVPSALGTWMLSIPVRQSEVVAAFVGLVLGVCGLLLGANYGKRAAAGAALCGLLAGGGIVFWLSLGLSMAETTLR